MSTTYATGINGNPIAASEVKPSSSLGTKLDGKASTSHTHSVIINGSTKEIAATGGSAVNLGTYLTSHQTIKQDGVTGSTSNRFGTCSTAAGTAGKEVSITSGTFSLEAGARVAVQFSNANTASSPTLKVGSTAAKNIFVNGSRITTGSNKGLLKGTVLFIYDGTQYNLIGNYYDSTYSGFVCANCSTAAGTAAKVASATNYTAKEGNVILVKFANTNSAAGALTLNVGGVTAPIRWNGTLTASGTTSAIPAGTWPCTYDGANWNIYTDGSYLYKRVYASDLIAANTISVGSTTPSYVELRQKLKDGVSTFYAVTLAASSSQVLFMPMLHNTNSTQLDYGSIGFGTVHGGIYYYVSYSSGNVWSSIYTVNLLSDTSISAGTDLTVSTSGGTVTIAVDTNGTASGTKAFVEGNSTTASANYGHAEGNGTTASQEAAHAEGTATTASGYNAHAEGQSSAASGDNAHAEGYNTSASRPSSHSEGTNSRAENKQAHAEGFAALAYGESSHAEGSCCVTGGVSAHAEGGATYAGGKDAHAEGFSNGYLTAELAAPMSAGSGTFTFASGTSLGVHNYIAVPSIGFFSKVIAAAGPTFTTQGSVSVALPAGTLCMFVSSGAVGYVSHSEGFKTLALERSTHAEGDCTQALGAYSHAEGSGTTASGAYSHAEGCGTTAGGNYSHTEGQDTVTSGAYAHAEGLGTVAQSDYMHVAGMYNYSKSGYARVTGWGTGTADTDRKDIERLDTSGNLWVSGNIWGNGTLISPLVVMPGKTHADGNPSYTDIWNAARVGTPIFFQINEPMNGTPYLHRVPARTYYTANQDVGFDVTLQSYNDTMVYNFTYRMAYDSANHDEPIWYYWLSQQGGGPTWVQMTSATAGSAGTPVPNAVTYKLMAAQKLKVNLSSGNAQSFDGTAAATNIGVSGTLPVSKGGTGKTSGRDAANYFMNELETESSAPTGNDYYISQYVGGGTTTTTYHRRPVSRLKEYILNGGTMTGQFTNTAQIDYPISIEQSTSGNDAMYKAQVGSISCSFGVGDGGTNHGIWSGAKHAWVIVTDENGNTTVNGNATSATTATKSSTLIDGGDSSKTINAWWKSSGTITGSNTVKYLAGFYTGNGADISICDIPHADMANYVGQYLTQVHNSDGMLSVTNGAQAGGVVSTGTIRLTGYVNKSSSSYTVSKTDISNGGNGSIYIYVNTYGDTQTVAWTNHAGTTSSGPVYPGCASIFICLNYANGKFARIS
jgi:hypothetical protein